MREAPKDGRTRWRNRETQPYRQHPVFNNPEVVPVGWYPLCPSSAVAIGAADSFEVAAQRIAVFRGHDGVARALDAFCPHMGADLANGRVIGDQLECYFHQWRYDGAGALVGVRCGPAPEGVRVRSWPVEEAYGLIWVWAGERPAHPVPRPPGLEQGEVLVRRLGRVRLYAHHHVMMAGGIDVQHFASVHGLSADMDVRVEPAGELVMDWHMRGRLPSEGWRGRAGRWLLGPSFDYVARVAGGSVITLAYGPTARLGGTGRALPPLYILWGGVPGLAGVSEVEVVLIAPRRAGLGGWAAAHARLLTTLLMLGVLRDDDVKAFPHMRFQTGRLVALDESVAKLVRFLNSLPVSPWSGRTAGDEQ